MAPVDDAALIALVQTYEQSFEEAQSPLVREMEAGGGVEAAPRLARSDDAGERLVAARLMHLLPDERHVAALVPLIADPDPDVADGIASRVGARLARWGQFGGHGAYGGRHRRV